ncbi:MAG: hypothetical protein IT262_11085 [Saprospiraceae bacterium]|nr:hypothetical protein [Saprospiraceae bacterium]
MKYILTLVLLFFIMSSSIKSHAQTIQPSKRFGSWTGAAEVRAQSQEYDLGCEIDVNFRLTLFTDGRYDIEILEYTLEDWAGKLCHIAAEGLWDAFIDENGVEFTRHNMFKFGGQYYLSFGLNGLEEDNLKHIKEEAGRVEVLHLDDRFLKIRIDLRKSDIKSQTLLLRRE